MGTSVGPHHRPNHIAGAHHAPRPSRSILPSHPDRHANPTVAEARDVEVSHVLAIAGLPRGTVYIGQFSEWRDTPALGDGAEEGVDEVAVMAGVAKVDGPLPVDGL